MTDVLDDVASQPASLDRLPPTPPPRSPRRIGRGVTVAAAGVALVAALALEIGLARTLVRAHHRAARERAGLAATRHDLSRTRAAVGLVRRTLAATESELDRRTGERDRAQVANDFTRLDIAGARDALAQAQIQTSANTTHIDALSTCLGGVAQALARVNAGDTDAAVSSLRAVSPSCEAVLASSGGDGPVFPFDFADPFLLRMGDVYYAYSTNSTGGNIQVITSHDLRHWEWIGNGLAAVPFWASRDLTWAPSVLPRGNTYVVYYTVHEISSGRQCISSGVSVAPQGPFVDDSWGPLVCEPGGSIDPSPFVDADGRAYLTWKHERVGDEPSRIMIRPLGADGRSFTGTSSELIHADQRWEGSVVEAPSMVRVADRYYLFYSGNAWDGRGYAVGYAVCDSPVGPCTKPSHAPVLASHGAVAGPGGQDFFTDPGGGLWMCYHAFSEPHVGAAGNRTLRVARVAFPGGRPTFAAP